MHRTPEEVCQDCPELLPLVRERLHRLRAVEVQVEALFPTPGASPTPPGRPEAGLPQFPGFAADPGLAANLKPESRHRAATFAALAGCGRGADACEFSDEERTHWRKQRANGCEPSWLSGPRSATRVPRRIAHLSSRR